MKKITSEEVQCLFEDADKKAPAVLGLYYMLFFQQKLLDIRKREAIKNIRPITSNVETMVHVLRDLEYPEEVIGVLPVQRILSQIHVDPTSYGNIYPPLLSLVVTQFPRFFLSENLLLEEEHHS